MRILYIPLFVPKLEKAHKTTLAGWEDDILKTGCSVHIALHKQWDQPKVNSFQFGQFL